MRIVPLRDPSRRPWDIAFSFQRDRISVRGRPAHGRHGFIELDAGVSFRPIKEIVLEPGEGLTPLQFYGHCRFSLFVEDILVSDKGKHLGSFSLLYIIQKFRTAIVFAGEARLQGRLGGRNEQTTEASARRHTFWTKLGCSLDLEKGLVEGDLKEIVGVDRKLDIEILSRQASFNKG